MLIQTQSFEATDAAGYYWVEKQRLKYDNKRKLVNFGKRSINYWADEGSTLGAQKNVTRCINPGMNHFTLRQGYFDHAYVILNDAVSNKS